MRFIVFAFVTLFFVGCGSDLKLSVKAADTEKDRPSAALVRKVELNYHDSAGQESMRENIPVLGLSQPLSIKSDLTKDLKWTKDGVFEARGYSSDGSLILRGTVQADPDETSVVEISMDRASSQAAMLGSALIRKLRLANAVGVSSAFEIESSLLRRSLPQCVDLPPLAIDVGAGIFPTLIIESSIKAPKLRYEVGVFDPAGAFKPWQSIQAIPINGNGDDAIEFGPQVAAGRLLSQ